MGANPSTPRATNRVQCGRSSCLKFSPGMACIDQIHDSPGIVSFFTKQGDGFVVRIGAMGDGVAFVAGLASPMGIGDVLLEDIKDFLEKRKDVTVIQRSLSNKLHISQEIFANLSPIELHGKHLCQSTNVLARDRAGREHNTNSVKPCCLSWRRPSLLKYEDRW